MTDRAFRPQKESLSPQTFLVDPFSADFLTGKKPYLNTRASTLTRPSATYVGWISGGGVIAMALILVYFAFQAEGLARLTVFASGLGVAFIAVFIWLHTLIKLQYEHQGQILVARLINISGQWVGGKYWGYYITLTYQFTSPTGAIIQNRLRRVRNDLREEPLPPPATPLAVLYLNDKLYRLL
jgi:hypothetical protein